MKKITFLLLFAITSTMAYAVDVTLTETYTNVVQTSAASANTKWTGNYFEWTVYNIRRGAADLFSGTSIPAGWFAASGYVNSSQPIEGGIKNLSLDWSQFGSETANTLRLMITIDNIKVDSIIRVGTLGVSTKQVYTKTLNSKKNGILSFNNTSYITATKALLTSSGRFLFGNITWTPYLYYTTKTFTLLAGAKYTNTAIINNLDIDMVAPVYTSSNPAFATVNASTGEVTGIAEGTSTITATSGNVSTTYTIVVKPANWKMETFTNISNVCTVSPTASSCSQIPVTDLLDNNISWTYWLGGGNTQIFGNNAMYIRARYNTETAYDYGYIKSDSIAGGLSGLRFQWNQGGTEAGYNYNVEVTVNGNVVGTITDAGESATFSTPKTFFVDGLTFDKKVVVKIENKSVYDGTSNKLRIVIDNLEWYGYTAIKSTTTSSDYGLSSLTGYSDIAVSGANTTLTINAPTSVKSLTVNQGAKVTLNDGQTLSAGTFSLQSDDSGTATFVDSNTSPSAINATVKQYLTKDRNWYISSPIAGATVESLLSNADSICYYDEPTAKWKKQTSGNLIPMKGYISVGTKITGNITFSDILNSGNQTIACTRTPSVSKSGFNLVGNPYPSYLNWSMATKTNIGSTIWYRTKTAPDIDLNSSYVFDTYNATGNQHTNLGATTVSNLIPPMQAFWVRVAEGQTSGTLTFNNTMRSHNDVSLNKMKIPSENRTSQQVLRLVVSNGKNSDEAIIYTDPNASNEFDDFDSPKMSNANLEIPEIYTLAGKEKLVINGLNNFGNNEELFLGFNTGKSNTFTLRASEFKNFATGTQILLKDNLLNMVLDISNGSEYTFSSDAVNSFSRFSIIFKSNNNTTSIYNSGNEAQDIRVYKNADNQIVITGLPKLEKVGNVTLFNSTGQKIYYAKLSGSTTTINQTLVSGIYIIKVEISGEKLIIKTTI